MDNCQSDLQSIFLTQLFTTLGQLTAGLVSATVAIPVLSYYSIGFKQFWYGM